MDYEYIKKCIDDYDGMSPTDVQNQIKPIIKSYRVDDLAAMLGVSTELLYCFCKKQYVVNNKKPSFATYIEIMAVGVNPECKCIDKSTWDGRSERVVKGTYADKKEYQHLYYMEVTKIKRRMKK